jgi:DNA-binding response OmpR family regulator
LIILVAEDEAMVAFALEWALRTAGHEVLGPAYTIDEALQTVRIRKPDLALVNLVLLGGEDGAVLALELLAQHGTPTILVSEDIQAARARRDVALGLIKKPYDAEMIPSIVWYLGELTQGRQPERMPPELELFHLDAAGS